MNTYTVLYVCTWLAHLYCCDFELIAPQALPAVNANMRSQYKLPNWADSLLLQRSLRFTLTWSAVPKKKKKKSELLYTTAQVSRQVDLVLVPTRPPYNLSHLQPFRGVELSLPTENSGSLQSRDFPTKHATRLWCRSTQPIHSKEKKKKTSSTQRMTCS